MERLKLPQPEYSKVGWADIFAKMMHEAFQKPDEEREEEEADDSYLEGDVF